jgi:hypothetical protein
LDTVPLFEGAFAATGGPDKGIIFPYLMIGNDPLVGGTTTIPAKITTVSLQLLNPDGSVREVVSFNPFESKTLDSPVSKTCCTAVDAPNLQTQSSAPSSSIR